ncbi:hypothetical protein BH18ACT2_BH18ACT2_20720 [soil metagenome]
MEKEAFLERALSTQLVAAPGGTYNYSNVGYSLLAAIIEERSAKTYETYLQEDVLAPAGLDGLGYQSVYEPVRSLRSPEGQPIGPVSWGGDRPYWNLIGNGGLLATPAALIRFLRAVDAGQVISAASVELTRTAHVAADAAGTSHYGYGLVVEDVANVGRISWHDGGNGTSSAEWMHVVGDGTVVFTAAADASGEAAFEAMAIVRSHLSGPPS